MFATPWCPREATRVVVEPVPVVLDAQAEPSVSLRPDPDQGARRPGVPRDVAQCLVDDAEQVRRGGRIGFVAQLVRDQLDVDHRVVAELLDDRGESGQQGRPRQQLRAQPEDEVPDVPDGQVQAVDRALDASLDLVRVVPHELGDVLQRQADRVDVLDDPVVQVLADALALVDDRQPLDLLVQSGVLDGDPGVDGERLDQALVTLGELGRVGLVGEVQVADRSTLHRDGHAQEAVHRRVVRRESVAPRIDRDVRDPERAVLPDDQAQEAMATRQRADAGTGLRVDTGGDESFDDATGVDDPRGGIPGPDEGSDLIDDDLQGGVDRGQAGDRPRGGVQGVDDVDDVLGFVSIAHPGHGTSARAGSAVRERVGPPGPEDLCRMAHGAGPPPQHPTRMNEPRPSRGQRILLAVDMTPASRDAANEAINRAATDGAQLIVLSVVEQHNLHIPGGRPRRVDQERDRLAAGAQAIVQQARAAGARATYLIWEGDPAEAILEASQAESADVIVLGSRPRLNVRRLDPRECLVRGRAARDLRCGRRPELTLGPPGCAERL